MPLHVPRLWRLAERKTRIGQGLAFRAMKRNVDLSVKVEMM
jgi:hypothetical protein